ncbi:hypothetical protein L3Q72_15510 [Vibrio sp. JC009]|uniref:hypothetical protein n=1 Tax=Vibrio sp. JC009 TaxID=2912314 RepID=UPI0023B0ECBF|nr:hypothetical protein [Vibrio sp. JC009]WED24289.1 hypothetical protein L3Q72_15510 [Vibrio sp. JC009]
MREVVAQKTASKPGKIGSPKSLKTRLLFTFLGFTLSSVLIIALTSLQSSYQSLRIQQLELFSQIAVAIEDKVLAIFTQAERDVQFLGDQGLSAADSATQKKMLQSLVLSSKLYQTAGVIKVNDASVTRVSRTSISAQEELIDLASSPLFSRVIEEDKRQVKVIFDNKLGEPIARLALPLTHPRNTSVTHVYFADLRLKSVWGAMAMAGLEDEREAYVISRDGKIVAHQNPSVVLGRIKVPLKRGELDEGLSGKLSVVYALSGKLNSLGLQVIVEQPVLKAYRLVATVLLNVFLIVCVSMILAYIVWRYLNRKVIDPLNQLSTAARGVSDGAYPGPIGLSDVEEINVLLSSFNKMVQDLKSAKRRDEELVSELATMNRTLESENRALEMTERELRKNQSLLKHAQKIARLGQWEMDLKSGAFSFSSETYAMFEFDDNEEASGLRGLLDMVDPQERADATQHWFAVPDQGHHLMWTNRYRVKNGVEKRITHRSEAIYDDTGKAVKVIGILQDVSAQNTNES